MSGRAAQVLSTLALLVLTSCSQTVHDMDRRPAVPTSAASPQATARAAGYLNLSAAQQRQLHQAEQLLTQRCMQRHGFQYWTEPQDPIPDDRTFPYVLTDVAWADQHGYGADLEAERETVNAADPNQIYFRSLTPAQRRRAVEAFNGDGTPDIVVRLPNGGVIARSSRGCTSEAEQSLYGDVRAYYTATTLFDNLSGEREEGVSTDPRFTSAFPGWSTCMQRHGYRYPNPFALRTDLDRFTAAVGPAGVLRLAGTEARCAQSSGLAHLVDSLDHEYRTRVEHGHAQLSAEIAALRAYGLRRAAQLMDPEPPPKPSGLVRGRSNTHERERK